MSGFSRNDRQAGALLLLEAATYQVSRRLVLDGGLRTGLAGGAPRVGAFAGLTVGLADRHRSIHSGRPVPAEVRTKD